MDPITLSILAALLIGGGGLYWYKEYGPGAAASSTTPAAPASPSGTPAVARVIDLDSSLPSGDQQAIIAAIMTQTSPAALTQMSAQYIGFPWAAYELNFRAWQLSGSQGAPPTAPTTAFTAVPTTPATPAQPQPAPNLPLNVLPPQPSGGGPAPAPAAPAAPPSGPFDLSAAAIDGAWQTNSAFITAYQGALTYLAWKFSQPTWAPAAVSGTYDTSTSSAVMAFQTSQGLSPVDGKVGTATATAIAAALTAPTPTTQTSGQGSYATYPQAGTGPGDSRYGAQGKLSVRGVSGRDQVHGLGEDSVQGLGEDSVQGLGEDSVQGLGEDSVQGAIRAAAKKTKEATKGLGEDSVQGLGEDSVQGLGEDEVQGVRRPTPKKHATRGLGEDSVQGSKKIAAQAVGAAIAAATPRARPRGGWYIHMRDTDSVWPRKIAEIGSGVPRGTPGSLQHLVDINPHLAAGGVMRQVGPGDEVNIPGSWASALRQKGFDVRPDSTEGLV